MKILIVIVRSPMAICVLSLTAGPVRTVRGPGRAVAVSRFALYRYRWPASMDTAGLNRIRGGVQYHPTLKAVRSTRSVDRGWLRMLPGQTVEDWAKVSDRYARPSAHWTAESAPSTVDRTSSSCGSSPLIH